MDDFHVGSIPPYDKYRHQDTSDSPRRKKAKRHPDEPPEQDDVVSLSGQADPASEPVHDYYTPSQPPEEQK